MSSQLDPLPLSRVGSRERASKSQLSATWLCETLKWVSPRDLGARHFMQISTWNEMKSMWKYSSYLYMHHSCFKCMTFVCKTYKPMKKQFSITNRGMRSLWRKKSLSKHSKDSSICTKKTNANLYTSRTCTRCSPS